MTTQNTGRIVKSKLTERFTTIPNDITQSEVLTMEQKGFLSYLLSLPSDWVLYIKNIYETLPDKQGQINRVFKELQDLGYIVSERVSNDKGQFIGWNHTVFDFPNNELKTDIKNYRSRSKNAKPKQEMAEVGENASILNKDINIEETKKENIQNSGSKEPVVSSLHSSIKNIFLKFYEESTATSYYWKALDGKKTNSIINQISFKIKQTAGKDGQMLTVTDNLVIKSFERLLQIIKTMSSSWYMLHLSMSTIDSKFNEIVALSTAAPIKPKEEVKFTGSVPETV